jgi:hypothetical protein
VAVLESNGRETGEKRVLLAVSAKVKAKPRRAAAVAR